MTAPVDVLAVAINCAEAYLGECEGKRHHALCVVHARAHIADLCEARAAVADSHEANVQMVDALNDAYSIEPHHSDVRISDTLPTSQVAAAYFAARAAIARVKGEQA